LQLSAVRALSVAATNDLISVALQFMKDPLVPPKNFPFLEDLKWAPPLMPAFSSLVLAPLNLTLMSDDLLFNYLVPSFEKTFFGQVYQR
jgi:hypothetical protein